MKNTEDANAGSLHPIVRVCGGCLHWKIAPDIRHIFGFAERLSKQIGRRVEIGYCYATCETGTGPTADADWCEKWKANSNMALSVKTDNKEAT